MPSDTSILAAEDQSQVAESENAQERLSESSTAAAGTTKQSREIEELKASLKKTLRYFPDFPIPGINFCDILPLFADPAVHEILLSALEKETLRLFSQKPDVIIALDARGFLFGPGLALRLGSRFAPVRKKGKLPGPVETATYVKEYGEDFFQIQADAVHPGQTVLVVDDIIATGGSAEAAGALVEKLGGKLLGFLFIIEIEGLNGRDKLKAPAHTLLTHSD